jgi:hypothetical protein
MSITLKIVEIIDKLRVQNYFVEKNNKTYFTPINIQLSTEHIETIIDKVFKTNGNAYKMNEFEKEILKELDF